MPAADGNIPPEALKYVRLGEAARTVQVEHPLDGGAAILAGVRESHAQTRTVHGGQLGRTRLAGDLDHRFLGAVHEVRASVRHTADLWREHGLVMRAAVDLSPVTPAIRALWTGTVTRYAAAMTEVLTRAGVPDPAVAEALCWMTERTFYWATVNGDDLDRTAEICARIWCATIRGNIDV